MLGEDQYYYRTQITPTFKIITPATSEPLGLSDLQSQLNADLIDDGGKYTRVLKAARATFEKDSGVSLMPCTWGCYLDHFPWFEESYDRRTIKLMRGPVTAVSSLVYVNSAGTTITADPTTYQTDIVRTPARVMPIFGKAWPVVKFSTVNAATITFTAGFSSVSLIPPDALHAILMLAGWWIENPTMAGTVGTAIYPAYQSLVQSVHWEVFDE